MNNLEPHDSVGRCLEQFTLLTYTMIAAVENEDLVEFHQLADQRQSVLDVLGTSLDSATATSESWQAANDADLALRHALEEAQAQTVRALGEFQNAKRNLHGFRAQQPPIAQTFEQTG